jgi:hypothetical protein
MFIGGLLPSVWSMKRAIRVAQRNLPSEVEAIAGFLGGLDGIPKIVMESTSA